jgi:hypothetical protein
LRSVYLFGFGSVRLDPVGVGPWENPLSAAFSADNAVEAGSVGILGIVPETIWESANQANVF